MSSIAGQLITGRLEYGGGRQVTVYLPRVPDRTAMRSGKKSCR
jgi:hypothetical protein